MNFLIIGHSVVDKIVEKQTISIKPGGIFYTVISLFSQMQKEDKLFLCTSIDKESEYLFKEIYDRVEKEFLSYVDSIPKVELVISELGERKEHYSQITQNLFIPFEDLNRFDGIMVNMISGYDISLNQLKKLREYYNGIIYFDVHTLSRGVDKKLNRIFRPINDFNKWAECIDILQANESELSTLSDKNVESEIVEELIGLGINQVIVTKAEKGATVYYSENKMTKKYHKDAIRVNIVNKVGCGDVFGAAYFYNYIKNKNVTLAIDNANLFAGISTTYSDAKEFLNLKEDAIEQIRKK